MTTDNHTAITEGAAADAATFNSPMAELDAAIGDLSSLTTTAKSTVVAAINEVDADVGAGVMEADYAANTILAADTDDTPAALTVDEQRLVGRITAGNIAALTATQIRTLISVEENADVTDATNVAAAGAVVDGDLGDITVSGSGTVLTIDADAVTYAKMQNMSATDRILGRDTAGAGVVEEIAPADLRTMINVEDAADKTDATNVNAAGAVMEADFDANTILAADTNDTPAALTVAEQTLVGRITAGNIDDLSVAQVRTLIDLTGQITGTKIDDLTAGDDNTDLDSTTARHGLLKKLDNSTTNFMRGDGSWAVPSTGYAKYDNLLANGGFRVPQRGTTFDATTSPLNSDDTYLLDRWVLLSDGNDIVDVTQDTTVHPTGGYASIKLEVETADKQFGIVQILEGKNAAAIIGGEASLSFDARMAAADDNTHSLKAVVLAWDGAEDTVTSDVVDTWGATATFVANWTGENTPGSNTLTTGWQTFSIENISIDTASAKNVAVFIYCDQTDGAVDDAVYISNVKLEYGTSATAYVVRPYAEELALCQRYCVGIITTQSYEKIGLGFCFSTTSGDFFLPLRTPMRTIPSLTAAASDWALTNVSAALVNATSIAIGTGVTEEVILLRVGVAGGLTAATPYMLVGDVTTGRVLLLQAEL